MTVLRWKGQSLLLHRFLTGPHSKAMRHGILPRYAQLAISIAIAGCKVAGMAKKAWRDDQPARLSLEEVKKLRASMNADFDRLEAAIRTPGFEEVSAVAFSNAKRACSTYSRHGNFGILALGMLEESAELAEPLVRLASGKVTLVDAKPQIAMESADLRIYLHIACEQSQICAETSTKVKWADVRGRYPAEAVEPAVAEAQPTSLEADAPIAKDKAA